MCSFEAYHVVTERPMALGQRIILNESCHNGVYRRVMEKLPLVQQIYAHPELYGSKPLEHHTAVALRELALEEVRRKQYPGFPSRMGCLYVSDNLTDAENWCRLFVAWGRPTYQIVRLTIWGSRFTGDANNCFCAGMDRVENLRLAERYWQNLPNPAGEPPIREILADGEMEVAEIIRRIDANIPGPPGCRP